MQTDRATELSLQRTTPHPSEYLNEIPLHGTGAKNSFILKEDSTFVIYVA